MLPPFESVLIFMVVVASATLFGIAAYRTPLRSRRQRTIMAVVGVALLGPMLLVIAGAVVPDKLDDLPPGEASDGIRIAARSVCFDSFLARVEVARVEGPDRGVLTIRCGYWPFGWLSRQSSAYCVGGMWWGPDWGGGQCYFPLITPDT